MPMSSLARHAAERLSRGVVLRRHLPDRYSGLDIFVSPECGGLKYWRRDVSRVDPALFAFIDDFVLAGACAWDVGANLGLFGFAALGRTGADGFVLMVEPDIDNVSLLLRSRRLLSSDFSTSSAVLPTAVGKERGVARFTIASRSRASNALEGFGNTQMGGAREIRHVPMIRLDDLLTHFRTPSVVKIDVEGAELSVLGGAEELLAQVRPIMHIEVARENGRQVYSLLARHGYRCFVASETSSGRNELTELSDNVIVIPKEAMPGLADRLC